MNFFEFLFTMKQVKMLTSFQSLASGILSGLVEISSHPPLPVEIGKIWFYQRD